MNFHFSTKRLVIGVFLIAIILLIAAIIIIILFLTGVISMAREPYIMDITTATLPPVVYPPSPSIPITQTPILPPVVAIPNYTYAGTFLLLRQANPAYDTKTSEVFRSAFTMIQSALTATVAHSSLQSYNPFVALNDIQNRGADLLVSFRLELQSRAPLDTRAIQNTLRGERTNIEAELGLNASIDPQSITVTQTFK
ncbi:unnamed protein product [Haemonchus placei]|uniref:SEA domain-containing protein n=1 Tax=Haemonchus placei TaxID=6290 RepID=A0A0N4X160_HAEPC|nr:unnamed protein product [Haemonchus placei]